MFSMTGYGKGEYKAEGIDMTVEIKTVNNRYLDISVKSPKIFNAYEEVIRSAVRKKLTRGHADIYINLVDKREKPKNLYVDMPAAKSWAEAAETLKKQFPALNDDFTLNALMKCADVVRQEEVQGADEALVVTTPEVSAVRDADRIIGLLESMEKAPIQLIINRIRPDMVKRGEMLGVQDVLDILAVDLVGVIPDDESIVVSSNRGEPLTLGSGSKAGQAYKNIAKRLCGAEVPFMDLFKEEGGFFASLRRMFSKG